MDMRSQDPHAFAYLDRAEFQREYADPDKPGRMFFHVDNVHCTACLARIEGVAAEMAGVRYVRLDMGRHLAEVQMASGGSLAEVAARLEDMGYPVRPVAWSEMQRSGGSNKGQLIRIGVSGACAGNIMLLTTSLYAGASDAGVASAFEWLSFVLFLPVLLYGAVPFYKNSWAALKSRRASIDVPIAAAVIVGASIGLFHLLAGAGDLYFDSLAVLVFLLLSSRYLLFQLQSRFLSPGRLRAFYETARVRVLDRASGRYEESHIDRVVSGDVVLVKNGERLPVDGVLLDAEAWVNAAVLTGEPHPRRILEKQDVFAGTELTTDEARIEVRATGADTRLGRLLTETERGVLGKTPLISFTDRVAQWFSVSVLGLALLFALIYSLVDVGEAINRALALVILACPCALALATPLTQSLALRKAARAGCLIRKAEAFEKLVQVQNAFFDKTGTLTQGELELFVWKQPEPSAFERSIIARLEAESRHPVAPLLVAYGAAAGGPDVEVTNIRETPGVGVAGDCAGDHYELRSLETGDEVLLVEFSKRVHTTVGFYKNGQLLTAASFSDRIRPWSKEAVSRIAERGVYAHLLTGDAQGPADVVAWLVGIHEDRVSSRQTPEDKLAVLQAHPRSLMVGDGVNDAVALANAHVSVAVHGSMEASFKAADIYLTEPGLEPLANLIDLSHATISIIKRNLVFSLIYNTTFGTLALLGLVNPLVAAILMPLSSVTVILSSVIGNRFWWSFNRARSDAQGPAAVSMTPLAAGGRES